MLNQCSLVLSQEPGLGLANSDFRVSFQIIASQYGINIPSSIKGNYAKMEEVNQLHLLSWWITGKKRELTNYCEEIFHFFIFSTQNESQEEGFSESIQMYMPGDPGEDT